MTKEHGLSASQIRYLINEWVLNETYRGILIDRMIHGRKFERIAEDYDMSVRRIKDIVCKYGDKVLIHADDLSADACCKCVISVTLMPSI